MGKTEWYFWIGKHRLLKKGALLNVDNQKLFNEFLSVVAIKTSKKRQKKAQNQAISDSDYSDEDDDY